MRVYKYEVQVPLDGSTEIEVPKGSQVLSVGIQTDTMVVWALVSSLGVAKPEVMGTEKKRLFVVNTGADFAMDKRIKFENLRFIGTVTHAAGVVWHVFEEK